MLSRLKEGKKVVGTKQVKRAIQNNEAEVVFVARDADSHVTDELVNICKQYETKLVYVDTMKELGEACEIEVSAASAAVLK